MPRISHFRAFAYLLLFGLALRVGWQLDVLWALGAEEGRPPTQQQADPPSSAPPPKLASSESSPARIGRRYEESRNRDAAPTLPHLGEPIEGEMTAWEMEYLTELARQAVPEALMVETECTVLPCRIVVLVEQENDSGLRSELQAHFQQLAPGYLDIDVGYARASGDPPGTPGTLAIVSIYDSPLSPEQQRFAQAAATMARVAADTQLARYLPPEVPYEE